MTSSATTSSPAPSISYKTILVSNLLAMLGQVLSGLSTYIDIYFVVQIGPDTLAKYAQINGWNIIAIAFLGGLLQSFLIIGGKNLSQVNRERFGLTFQATLLVALVVGIAVQAVVIAIVFGQTALLESSLQDTFRFAVLLAPGFLFTILTVVLRMRCLLLSRMGAFIAIPVAGVLIKLALLWIYKENGFDFVVGAVATDGVMTAASVVALGNGLMLLVAIAITLSIGGGADLRHRAPWRELLADSRQLFIIGVQIGFVIAVELAVLGIGQLMVAIRFPELGGTFSLAIHTLILIETFAVAMGQVTTVSVAIVAGQQRARLTEVIFWCIAYSLIVHVLIMVMLLIGVEPLAQALAPQQAETDLAATTVLIHNLRIVAGVQLLLALVITLAAVLRGLGDISRPILLVIVNYIGLGLGTSILLLAATRMQQDAVWIGIALSLVGSIVALGLRVRTNLREPVAL